MIKTPLSIVNFVTCMDFTCTSTLITISSSHSSPHKKFTNISKHKHIQTQIKIPNQNQNHLELPKSYPNPLIITQKPYPKSRIQALDAIVKDLETSIKNGITINSQIFSSLLETCFQLQAIEHGIRIHNLIPDSLLRRNEGISSKLLRLYASAGYIDDAHQVFDQMLKRDLSAFSWNSMISGYAELGMYEDALALYFQMEEDGVDPDCFTFPRVLKACGGIGIIQVGEEVHRHIVRSGFGNDVFVLNGLVDMYAKCGHIVKARRVFDKMPCKDLVSWNSMLTAYVRHELLLEAMQVFKAMVREEYEPDSVSVSALLTGGLQQRFGTQIHGWVIRRGKEWNLSIANSLIVFYSNIGKLERSRILFDEMPERDVVSWNSIISAHRKHANAISYFQQMMTANVVPNSVTFVSLLSACAHLGMVKEGERFFLMMRKSFNITPIMEHFACMVNLYGRAGLITEAHEIIVNKMESEAGPTVWGALLYACFLHKNVEIGEIAACNLFDLEPDNEQNFELLMKIYEDANCLEDAERVRMMMIQRGLD